MFDGNAAGVEIGELFFAEAYEVNEQLKRLGVKEDALILCQHVEKRGFKLRETVHTKIWLSPDSEPMDYFDADDDERSLLVYSGLPTGYGFICEVRERQALALLNGAWLKGN